MTTTTKGLTLDQRRTLNRIPWGPARMAAIRAIHRDTPLFVDPDGRELCRLNRTTADDCPNCA